jgi:site-specific DNA recombinase
LKRAVIYARISLDRSEGAAIERQIEACRGLAVARGWDVVDVRQEAISAYADKDRPEWENVKGMIRRGEVDVILAYHMDRITRTMQELESLILLGQEYDVGVATATGDIDLTTDTGRMVARILAAVARAEVECKGARQKAANLQRAKNGEASWLTRPFGFERDGSHRPNEAEALRHVYRMILDGGSLYAACQRLNGEGLISSYGKPWSSRSLKITLTAARNAGIRVYQGEEIAKGDWEPIIPEATFRAVCRILDRNTNNGGGGVRQNLLSGFATCGKCGGSVKIAYRGGSRRKSDPNSYAVYECRSNKCAAVPADFLDGLTERKVVRNVEAWNDMLDAPDMAGVDTDALSEERKILQHRLTELGEAFAEGDINRATLRAGSEKINARVVEIDEELAAALPAEWWQDIEAVWAEYEGWPLDRKRDLISRMVESVEILPKGKSYKGSPRNADFVRVRLRGEDQG